MVATLLLVTMTTACAATTPEPEVMTRLPEPSGDRRGDDDRSWAEERRRRAEDEADAELAFAAAAALVGAVVGLQHGAKNPCERRGRCKNRVTTALVAAGTTAVLGAAVGVLVWRGGKWFLEHSQPSYGRYTVEPPRR